MTETDTCNAERIKGAVSHAPEPSAENLSLLVILLIVGHKLSAFRIAFVFVDIEEVSLSFLEMSINVSQFEDCDIIPVDANDLSALSDDRVTGNLHGNRVLFYLVASCYALACNPQVKGWPEELTSLQTGPVRVTLPL